MTEDYSGHLEKMKERAQFSNFGFFLGRPLVTKEQPKKTWNGGNQKESERKESQQGH